MKTPVIGLVGPCKSGKTTLKRKLEEAGFQVRHIAQEHSYAKEMWLKIANPDILIYLDVSFKTTLLRSNLSWTITEYQKQIDRLSHARQHAHLTIQTDDKSPEQIFSEVIAYLNESQLPPNNPAT